MYVRNVYRLLIVASCFRMNAKKTRKLHDGSTISCYMATEGEM
jgi:hypothetical protein